MRRKLLLFDNPTIKRLHSMCYEFPIPESPNDPVAEGVQLVYAFPNKWGASVVQVCLHVNNRTTWLIGEGQWELGLLEFGPDGSEDFKLTYTDEFPDVLKPLTPTRVEKYLQQISKLESA